MVADDYNELRTLAMNTAKKVALSFLEEYRKGPYGNELSPDRINFFYYNTDFEAGLNYALFTEFKRLDLWRNIEDDDWDNAVKLAMETAYNEFVCSQNKDSSNA